MPGRPGDKQAGILDGIMMSDNDCDLGHHPSQPTSHNPFQQQSCYDHHPPQGPDQSKDNSRKRRRSSPPQDEIPRPTAVSTDTAANAITTTTTTTTTTANTTSPSASTTMPAGEVKKKYDPKDPLRPRRKKARRACFACQRAHLTCGDERPCQRCIKRKLADECRDGVRKKAKYLHDAPPEALRPVLGPNYNLNTPSPRSNAPRHSSTTPVASINTPPVTGAFFSPPHSASFPVFSSAPAPMASLSETAPFVSQPSPVSPTFHVLGSSQPPQLSSLSAPPPATGDLSVYQQALFDPNSSPGLFTSFNLDDLQFGSQYGALEFDMLGRMSSGAVDTPPHEQSLTQRQQQQQSAGPSDMAYCSTGIYDLGMGQFEKVFDGDLLGDSSVSLDPPNSGLYATGNLQHGLPHAYAIAAAPPSLPSPGPETQSPQTNNFTYDASQTVAATAAMLTYPPVTSPTATSPAPPSALTPSQPPPPAAGNYLQSMAQSRAITRPRALVSGINKLAPQSILGKRQRDSSYIYDTTNEPYLYVKSFHSFQALLQRLFTPAKTLRIAKALASIRPSFITCMRTLNRQDLIFMEKSFQRQLFEYEDFMSACSSPAIACRRTGEVAQVNKEFTALTGWTKDILLGKEPNLNVNTGHNHNIHCSAPAPEATKAAAEIQPQAVFLAELMDDDSVVQFYEDYAKLAFNNSRGTVKRKCRLLKYRTSQQQGQQHPPQPPHHSEEESLPRQSITSITTSSATPAVSSQQRQGDNSIIPTRPLRSSILSKRVTRIDGEHGISKIEKDGKLECSYTWTIKRDTFDIPMMIIINFLPCYDRHHNPLAV